MGDRDERRRYAVTADEPVTIDRPRRKVRLVSILSALALVVSSSMGTWIATDIAHKRASAHTDRRIAAVEEGLAARRQARDDQFAEMAKLVCVFADRVPRDPYLDEVRRRYGCDVPPSPSPTGGR